MTTTTTITTPDWLSTLQGTIAGDNAQLLDVLTMIAQNGDDSSQRRARKGIDLHWRLATTTDSVLNGIRVAFAEVLRSAS